MHTRFTNLWGNVRPTIPLQWITWWTYVNAISWTYISSQNTTICTYTFYESSTYSWNFWNWSPSRQRADLPSPSRFGPYFTPTSCYAAPYGYVQKRTKNFQLNNLRSCYAKMTFCFSCAKSRRQIYGRGTCSWHVALGCTCNLLIKIPRDW